jgi:ankyrin repeat protein
MILYLLIYVVRNNTRIFCCFELLRELEGASYGVAKLLLETGKVDLEIQNYDGETLLSWAVKNENTIAVKLLLVIGKANVDLKHRYGQTPLCQTTKRGVKPLLSCCSRLMLMLT